MWWYSFFSSSGGWINQGAVIPWEIQCPGSSKPESCWSSSSTVARDHVCTGFQFVVTDTHWQCCGDPDQAHGQEHSSVDIRIRQRSNIRCCIAVLHCIIHPDIASPDESNGCRAFGGSTSKDRSDSLCPEVLTWRYWCRCSQPRGLM
jgi:hypothetical protein